jgi:hypothetical protein
MAGLDPAIHVFPSGGKAKTWMPGTRPGMTAPFERLAFGCGFLPVARKLPVCDPVPTPAILFVPGDQLNLEILLFVGQSDVPILFVQGNQLRATLVSRKPSRCGERKEEASAKHRGEATRENRKGDV